MKKLIVGLMLMLLSVVSFGQTLDETLSKVVEKAMQVAETTGEFVVEQAPLLLQEFYNWHIASSIFFVILSIMILIFGIWGHKAGMRYNDGDWAESPAAFLGDIIILLGVVMLVVNLYDLIFILVAPKLYLIEYFMASGGCN